MYAKMIMDYVKKRVNYTERSLKRIKSGVRKVRFHSKRHRHLPIVIYCARFWSLKATYYITKSVRILAEHL